MQLSEMVVIKVDETENLQKSAFDMSHPALDPFPDYRPSGYFNQAWVQAALGVPVNMTEDNYKVAMIYASGIADAIRGNISNLEYVLSKGYSVHMVHGDRDYRCNWLGGEAISLAAKWRYTREFNNAGYADIETNATYDGGYVRQVGKFSFSRVFQAGHAGEFSSNLQQPILILTTSQSRFFSPRQYIVSFSAQCLGWISPRDVR